MNVSCFGFFGFSRLAVRSLCGEGRENPKENFEVSPSTFHSKLLDEKTSNESVICKPGYDDDNDDVYLE